MEFEEKLLGEILTFQRGFDITKSEQSPGPVPIVSSSGVTSFHNTYRARGPGVVIGRKGTLGTVHYIDGDYWPHDTTLWIKDFKGNDPRFICNFLKTLRLESFDTGSSNPTLNRNHLHKIRVLFPKPFIQVKIAAILSAYDDLIENNKRRIGLLEHMAEEIYREWFVRFRFPGWETAKFEKGGPREWHTKRFDEFCQLKRGYDLPDSDVEAGDYPVIASTSIKTYHKYFKVEPPVITTGRSGSLGAVLFTQEKAWPLNTSLYVRDFKGNSPYYVYYTLKGMSLESFNSGAGVPTLNRNHLGALKLSVPSQALQDKFGALIEPIFTNIELLQAIAKTASNAKDQLLPRLISGKLSVADLDIQFPPSMQEQEP